MSQEKNQLVVCGKAIFKLNLNKNIINGNKNLLNDNKLISQLQKMQWAILQGDYQKKNWKILFQNMDSSNAQEIQFDWNYNTKIIKQIYHVNFNQLKVLSLSFNNIDNLEAFSWIKSPKLNQLFLNYNNIFRFNSFVKCLSKTINKLIINQNPINELQSISRFNFQQKLVEKLALDIKQQGFSYLVGQDISFIFKINAQNIANLWNGHKNRIIQQKVIKMIRKSKVQIQILDNQESSSDEDQNMFQN